jgi:serine protease Do
MNDFERGQYSDERYVNKGYSVLPYYPAVIPEKKKGGFKRIFSIFMAFVIGAGLTAGVGYSAMKELVASEIAKANYNNGISVPVNPSLTPTQAATPIAAGDKKLLSTVEIARNVGPTVVGINSKTQVQSFWGMPQTAEGSGSGILISQDGYIVTNNHVIEGANEIKVILNNGKEHQAKVIGSDSRTDLAVIKIDVTGIKYAVLGDSSTLQVGELAVAIGNPLGNELAGSVTLGIISALNRTITVDNRALNLIQTDAAINPGNSGGALVNNYGEVIGINSIKMKEVGVEGIGFAIPINEAKPVIEDLMNGGYVKGRPVIGIGGRNVTEQDAKAYSIPVGVYITEVAPYSAAELAGIRQRDVVIKFNGVEVKTVEEINTEKEKYKVGDTVKITLNRNGEERVVDLTLLEDKPAVSQ